MTIKFDYETRIFHIHNKFYSYVLCIENSKFASRTNRHIAHFRVTAEAAHQNHFIYRHQSHSHNQFFCDFAVEALL